MVLNPHTPVESIRHVLDMADLVLVMSVNPGFGGQSFLPGVLPKLTSLRQQLDELGLDAHLEIDGGISADTIGECAAAGANVFVSGSALFRYDDKSAGVAELKAKAEARLANQTTSRS